MALSQQLNEHKLKGNYMIEVTLKDSTTISAADYSATKHYLEIEDTTIPLADISHIETTQDVGLKAFWEEELSQDIPTITTGLVAL